MSLPVVQQLLSLDPGRSCSRPVGHSRLRSSLTSQRKRDVLARASWLDTIEDPLLKAALQVQQTSDTLDGTLPQCIQQRRELQVLESGK